MSEPDYLRLVDDGIMPASTTGETFVSPSTNYLTSHNAGAGYQGVMVRFALEPGTMNKLLQVGIRHNSALGVETLSQVPFRTGAWVETNTLFKVERGVVTTGLGRGEGLRIFNQGVVQYERVAPRARRAGPDQ